MNEENNLNQQPNVTPEVPVTQTAEQTPAVAPVETVVQPEPTPVEQPVNPEPQQPVVPQGPAPQPVENQTPANNIPPAKKNGHNLIVVIIVAIVVAILVFVVVGAVTSKDKDDNKKDNEQKEENKKEEENKEDEKDSSYIEGDWTSMKFHFDGHTYTLMTSVQELSKNGWNFDPDYLKETDSLESMHKTYSTLPLLNPKYEDSDISVGLINKTPETKKFTECNFWSINISNDWIDTPVEFSLPGGIKNGSTLAEIEQVYGKPEDDDIYRSETLKYYSYTYEQGDILLDLTIYDDKGLTEFSYKYYG